MTPPFSWDILASCPSVDGTGHYYTCQELPIYICYMPYTWYTSTHYSHLLKLGSSNQICRALITAWCCLIHIPNTVTYLLVQVPEGFVHKSMAVWYCQATFIQYDKMLCHNKQGRSIKQKYNIIYKLSEIQRITNYQKCMALGIYFLAEIDQDFCSDLYNNKHALRCTAFLLPC